MSRMLCWAMSSNTRNLVLDSGHTVSRICSSMIRCIRRSSSMARTPWSIRWIFSRSMASQMYSGGPSSPAWATVRKPSWRARSNTRWNLLGGWPISELSRPTATNASRNGSAWSRVFSASASLKWRRKLRIKPLLMPSCCSPSLRAAAMPLSTTSKGMPRSVWVCGSKKGSVWITFRLAAQQVGPGQVVEVLGGAQHVGALVIEVEEFLQVVEGIGLAQGVHIVPRQGDLVAFGQGKQQLRLQRAFQVQVQFCLGQGIEPVVHGLFSHQVQWVDILQMSVETLAKSAAGAAARHSCRGYRLPGNGLALVVDEVMPAPAGIGIDLIDQAANAGGHVDVRAFAAHVGFHPARVHRQDGKGRCLDFAEEGAGHGVQRGLARLVESQVRRIRDGHAAQARTHEGNHAIARADLADKTLGQGHRGDGIGHEQLADLRQ